MSDRQEKVIAEITIRKLIEPFEGKEYATVVDFGVKTGRIIKSFDTYDESFEYANEANQFLYGEDYKDELQ
tara:strand:+ start:733 stop:945 length:213 start_codon:yes stop_codon:yes gene_type:complete